jgi:hypothetical protein
VGAGASLTGNVTCNILELTLDISMKYQLVWCPG